MEKDRSAPQLLALAFCHVDMADERNFVERMDFYITGHLNMRCVMLNNNVI